MAAIAGDAAGRTDVPPAPPRRELRRRILSAAVLAPVGIAILVLGGPGWKILVALGVAGVAHEWASMREAGAFRSAVTGSAVTRSAVTPPGAPARVAGFVALALLCLAPAPFGWPVAGVLLLLPAALIASLFAGRAGAVGLPYVVLPGIALVWLRQPAVGGAASVLFVMLVVWASDSGAYAAGRVLGGPRLAPRLSPSKTWSGAAGGLVCAIAIGLAFAALAARPPLAASAAAAVLGIASQAGDLAESAAKRRFGVKDSGHLIPGHGGLLDRMDGLMSAAVAAALARLLGLW